MPKLIIDNREIEVPQGTKVIDAAERLGIMIPRFCYHPALGSVGACRVCAVKFEEGPVKGIQMSCMVDAADGMKVSTTDPEAMDFRKHVIEFLMLNHPHDCPVCDEGGHCLLQDMTVSGGHGLRRYRGNKRTHTDQYLGPLVQHEMNRCIQCYRCVRYYREFSGYRDLGVMGIGSRVYYGRHKEGVLESPFAGNLIDICPTGVYTDKPARFKGRKWDFERHPSLCIHCALGCAVTVSTRYREVMRQEARFDPAVNGHFICDRGRFGFPYVNAVDRPRAALVDGRETTVPEALVAAAQKLTDAKTKYGNAAIAAAGGCRSSLETMSALSRLCREKGYRTPAFFADAALAGNVAAGLSAMAEMPSVSLPEIADADFIWVVGADPVNEAPMLALSLRQAVRNGARVVVWNPRPVALPFEFEHQPMRRNALTGNVEKIRAAFASGDEPSALTDVETTLLTALKQARRPVVVCGLELSPAPVPGRVADIVRALRSESVDAGLSHVFPAGNAVGAGLFSDPDHTMERLVAEMESGRIKVLIMVEQDLFFAYPDRKRLAAAFENLELLIAIDCINTPLMEKATVAIPSGSIFETGGGFARSDGTVRQAMPVFRGGSPVLQTGHGDHPPRRFDVDIPGGGQVPAWECLAALISGEPGRPTDMADIHPALAGIDPTIGGRMDLAAFTVNAPQLEATPDDPERWDLVTCEGVFGTEELSFRSPPLKERAGKPKIILGRADAEVLGIAANDRIALATEGGEITALAQLAETMAPRTIVLPRHGDSGWQKAGDRFVSLNKSQIRKKTEGGS